MDSVAAILKSELHQLIVDGIKYERIPITDPEFEWRQELFKNEELINYLTALQVGKSGTDGAFPISGNNNHRKSKLFFECQYRFYSMVHSMQRTPTFCDTGCEEKPVEASKAERVDNSYDNRSRGSGPVPARGLVRLGVAGLDSDARPPRSADTAHRFRSLRHRHPVSSLAAVPAHRGGSVA
jgi:hypothetical protein